MSTRLAHRKLPDGRNAHLTVKPIEWWAEKIKERFNILKLQFRQAYLISYEQLQQRLQISIAVESTIGQGWPCIYHALE